MNLIEAQDYARLLMDRHGLQHWSFEFDRAVRRFGRCSITDKKITLSKPLTLANPVEHVKDTILHEIAHALCPPKRTRGKRQWDIHGPDWQKAAMRIGCTATRCYGDEVAAPDPVFRKQYKGTCPTCQRVINAYRRRHISCGKCCKTYNPQHRIIWTA